jgi:hypothetical protein
LASNSLKPEQAHKLNVPSRSRSPFARDSLDCAAEQLPGRHIRTVAENGDATKDSVRHLPDAVQAVGRCPISDKLYELPPKPALKRHGAPRKKGRPLGSPKTVAKTEVDGAPHASETGAVVHAWCGLWLSVRPGRLIRLVVVRHDATRCPKKPGQRKPPPPVEAYSPTDLSLSTDAILHEYRDRGAVAIERPQPTRHCLGLSRIST